MNWKANAVELLDIVLRRAFPAGYDFEKNWPLLLADFRAATGINDAGELERLRTRIAELDEAEAAEQRLRKTAGVKAADIETLKNLRK